MIIEGVFYEVDWRKFKKGRSIFLPCLDQERAQTQLIGVTDRLNINILIKFVIEDGIRGLRVWRT
jgi:hypothetical protein